MTQQTDPHRLCFAGDLTMRRAQELCIALREAIETHPGLEIDCTAATETDLTFVQLLLAARASARAAGRRVALSAAPSGALAETLARAGFAPMTDAAAGGGHWFESAPT